jgi:hypothetical protein
MPRNRATSCTGKIRYANRDSAWRAAKEILKRAGEKLRPYCCGYCGSFHIGHQRRAPRLGKMNRLVELIESANE